MLNWTQKHPWLTAVTITALLVTGLFFGSFFISFVREICTKDEYINKPDCAEHYLGPWVLLWIGQVIDAHNGFVTAIATIFIAAFTLVLYRATNKQVSLYSRSHR